MGRCGWHKAPEGTTLIHKHARTHIQIDTCTWPFTNYMQCNTDTLILMNFGAGLVSPSDPSCMALFFLYVQFDGISVESRVEMSTANSAREFSL